MYCKNGLKLKLLGFGAITLLVGLLSFVMVSPVAIADGGTGGGEPPSRGESIDTSKSNPNSSSDPSGGTITSIDLLITELAVLATQVLL